MREIALGFVCFDCVCSGTRIALGASSQPAKALDTIPGSHSFAEVNLVTKGEFHPFKVRGILGRRGPYIDDIGDRVRVSSNIEHLRPSDQRFLPARPLHQAAGWPTWRRDCEGVPVMMSSSDSNDADLKIYSSGDAHIDARDSNDPVAKRKGDESRKHMDVFNFNLGKAIDSLNTDIPEILRAKPNWGIYTDDLEVNLPVLLFGPAGGNSTKIKGRIQSSGLLLRLQRFARSMVEWDKVKVNTRLLEDGRGWKVIECRWNAQLGIKRLSRLGKAVSFLRSAAHVLLGARVERPSKDIFDIEAVSSFDVDSKGKIYRHVIDSVELKVNSLGPASDAQGTEAINTLASKFIDAAARAVVAAMIAGPPLAALAADSAAGWQIYSDLHTSGQNVIMPENTLQSDIAHTAAYIISTAKDSRIHPILLLALPAAASASILKSAVTQVAWCAHLVRNRLSPCMLGRDVEVRPNRLGRGLYARRDLEEGELIGRYTGPVLSNHKYQRLTESGGNSGLYAMQLPTGDVVDGEDERRSSFVRFINHSKRKENCQAVDWAWPAADGEWLYERALAAVYIETTRPVAKGEELFMDYGPTYWDAIEPRFSPKRLIIDYL